MGSTEEEISLMLDVCVQSGFTCPRRGMADEGPLSEHSILPFWIDRTQVTRAMYQNCVDSGACERTPVSDFSPDCINGRGCDETLASDFSEDDSLPINRVTWFQAQAYCEWRGGRLPTEAEWEYAARGPDDVLFPWGNEIDGSKGNHCDGNCGQQDWADGWGLVNEQYDDGYGNIAPVGSYPEGVSWVGALDMSGNVGDWVSSLYQTYPYDAEDGRESIEDDHQDRVRRGGSFTDTFIGLHAANRHSSDPNSQDNGTGFRCALSFE